MRRSVKVFVVCTSALMLLSGCGQQGAALSEPTPMANTLTVTATPDPTPMPTIDVDKYQGFIDVLDMLSTDDASITENGKSAVFNIQSDLDSAVKPDNWDDVRTELVNAANSVSHLPCTAQIYAQDGTLLLSVTRSNILIDTFGEAGVVDPNAYTYEELPIDQMPLGYQNAVKKAKSYIEHQAFSANRLKEQLIFEKFTEEEAIYGVKHCGADWNEEAAQKAKSYLSHQSFSRDGLIDQLKFEGFTEAQAEYGVTQAGY